MFYDFVTNLPPAVQWGLFIAIAGPLFNYTWAYILHKTFKQFGSRHWWKFIPPIVNMPVTLVGTILPIATLPEMTTLHFLYIISGIFACLTITITPAVAYEIRLIIRQHRWEKLQKTRADDIAYIIKANKEKNVRN